MISAWIVVVILPAVEADFAASRAMASAPYTMTLIGFGIGNLVIGRLVDRLGITLVLTGTAVVSAAIYLLAILAPTITVVSLTESACWKIIFS